jgi:hypothetical protein
MFSHMPVITPRNTPTNGGIKDALAMEESLVNVGKLVLYECTSVGGQAGLRQYPVDLSGTELLWAKVPMIPE